jgi:uncharacterized membrane protein YfcA
VTNGCVRQRKTGLNTHSAWVFRDVTLLVLDFSFFAIAAPAVVFAGISKGGFGSGPAFAAATILALILPPGLALGVMLPLLMLMDVASLRPYWGKWRWHEARLLILGGVPGVALGAGLFSVVDDDVFRVLIGGISVAFVVWRLLMSRGWVSISASEVPDWQGGLAGFAAGFTSFVSHAGGPPAAVYLLSRGVNKTEYQAITVLVFWVINIVKFVPYAFLGMFTLETALANLALAPFALIGTWLGVKAHHIVPERIFFAVTYVVLMITGCKLIFDGLT